MNQNADYALCPCCFGSSYHYHDQPIDGVLRFVCSACDGTGRARIDGSGVQP